MDFYRGLLARLPDSVGFAHWVQQFRAAQCQGAAAVTALAEALSGLFVASAEYSARGRGAALYVADLYNALLRRGGDLAGVRFWIDQLERSTLGAAEARKAFLASPEFTRRVDAVIAQGCIN
jgi:hypothetical protein